MKNITQGALLDKIYATKGSWLILVSCKAFPSLFHLMEQERPHCFMCICIVMTSLYEHLQERVLFSFILLCSGLQSPSVCVICFCGKVLAVSSTLSLDLSPHYMVNYTRRVSKKSCSHICLFSFLRFALFALTMSE